MTADHWLTVDLVEKLHEDMNRKNDASAMRAKVSQLSQATLPGLLEYWCLHVCRTNVPVLPPVIRDSHLGHNLVTALKTKPHAVDMKPRECEVLTCSTEDDLVSDPVEFFQMRFSKSARQVGFTQNACDCLHAGLNEMMTNAVQHSGAPKPIIAGYSVQPNVAQFAVVDVGRGVLNRLRQRDLYSHLSSHVEAIRLALRPGVTSDPSGQGGFGFNDIFKALTARWGHLRFRSGKGVVVMDGTGLNPDAGSAGNVPARAGFTVSVTCRVTPAPLDHPIV